MDINIDHAPELTTKINRLIQKLNQSGWSEEGKENIKQEINKLEAERSATLLSKIKVNMPAYIPVTSTSVIAICTCCSDTYEAVVGHISICAACLKFIGELRKAKENWIFKE